MSYFKEHAVGETVVLDNGVTAIVVERNGVKGCERCALFKDSCFKYFCGDSVRKDHKRIYYQEILKPEQMEKTKKITIDIPEGYEIDTEKSTFTEIIFRKKNCTCPKTWEEYVANTHPGHRYFIDSLGKIHEYSSITKPFKSAINTEAEAEAFLALIQLRQLWKAWVGDWKVNIGEAFPYTIIPSIDDTWCIVTTSVNAGILAFPTRSMAEEFAECFKDLLESARPLFSC